MSRRSPFINQQFITVTRQSMVAVPFLDNLTRAPHWLHEIRFAAFTPSVGVALLPDQELALWMSLEVGLRIQDAYLAHPDVVPASTVLSPLFDRLLVGQTIGASLPGKNVYGGVWTLPEPLFVPAGSKLYCAVRFNPEACPNLAEGIVGISSLNVFVNFVGQRAYDDVAPRMSRVPFAASWRTPIATMGEGGVLQEFRSPDAELYNFTKDQVVVQRVVARNYGDNLVPTTVRYNDQRGRYVNKDFTPLLELHQNGVWNLGCTMQPKDFFSVEGTIDSRTARALPGTNLTAFSQQGAVFGLVGYRDIPTHVLWGPSLVAPPSSPVAPGGEVARVGSQAPMQAQGRVPRKVVP